MSGPSGLLGQPHSGAWRRALAPTGAAVRAALVVLAGSALAGLAAGLVWAAVAPHPVYTVVSRGVGDVVNPETSAFIGADAAYVVLGLVTGGLIGLVGFLAAVRRHGPVAMLGVVLGALSAGLVAWWTGEQPGAAEFNRQLLSSRTGTLLRAPLTLGAHSAVAFWPLASCLVAGILVALWGRSNHAAR